MRLPPRLFQQTLTHHPLHPAPMSAFQLEPTWPDTDLSDISFLEFQLSDSQSLFASTHYNLGPAENQEDPNWFLSCDLDATTSKYSRQSIGGQR